VGADADWVNHGGAHDGTHFSRLEEISADNVGSLGLAWYLDLDGEQMLEATPLAIAGVLYFTGSYSKVYAVDGKNGALLWQYDPEAWKTNQHKLRFTLPVNRGVAYADGRVFVGVLTGDLAALDAKTGKMLWRTPTVAAESPQAVTGAPLAFKNKVLIGNSGGDFGARGYVTAYDQATGKTAWRFYIVPGSPTENEGDPAMEAAAKTWDGEYWKTGTGGSAWHGLGFDPDFNLVYVGTGNSGPYDPAVRSPGNGDNLYLSSIVALDADSGKLKWHYQTNPREAWDYKATANMVLATVKIDGVDRKVLMQAPTNGYFYVLDRQTGKLISAEAFAKVTWAKGIDLKTGRPIENPNIRYENGPVDLYPSPVGAHNWQAMSYNPVTGLAYIPAMQLGMRYEKTSSRAGAVDFGGLTMSMLDKGAGDGTGSLIAWDPRTQTKRWEVPHKHLWNGGTLATAGGLVFQGTADGKFAAYDATTGKTLWQFAAGLGIISDPVSYMVAGRQFVSVLVGYGNSNMLGGDVMNVGWKFGAQPRRLLTFALNGKAKLPRGEPASFKIAPADNPAVTINDADVARGRILFTINCANCHGLDAVSAGAPAPDLRESFIATDPDALWKVAHDGALLAKGMPRFDKLTRPEVNQINAYIISRAREAAGRRPSSPTGSMTGARM
jgi:quinohemoprotein ethanol dehydrogenase